MEPDRIPLDAEKIEALKKEAHDAPMNKVFEDHDGHRHLGSHSNAWAEAGRRYADAVCPRIPLDAGTTRPAMGGEIAAEWTVAQLVDHTCSLAMGYGTGRDDLRTEYRRFRAALLARLDAAEPRVRVKSYQERVNEWMLTCFNDEIAFSVTERNHRFLEEALELVQSQGCTASEAHQLVDYVYGRDVGEPPQEVGGVLVCLAALCNAAAIGMDAAGETELARIWTKVEKIRAKHAAKPQFSPLPGNLSALEGGTHDE